MGIKDIFVPLLGLTAAVIATLGSLLTTVFGPFKRLRLPLALQDGNSRGFLNVLLFAPFIICFVLVSPPWARWSLILSLLPLVFAILFYSSFRKQIGLNRYTKPKPRRFLHKNWTREDIILGGTDLTNLAKIKEKGGADLQILLAEAEYDPDKIWTRKSRIAVQQLTERHYYGFMLSSLLTVVLASLSLQSLLSGESPLESAKRVWKDVTELPDPTTPGVETAVVRNEDGKLAITMHWKPIALKPSQKLAAEFSTNGFESISDTYEGFSTASLQSGRATLPLTYNYANVKTASVRLRVTNSIFSRMGTRQDFPITGSK